MQIPFYGLEGMRNKNLGKIPKKYAQYLGDISPNFNVLKIKTANILTDTKRFQNRDEAYSAKSVARIVNDFKPEKFDPLRVWKDKNGKIYVVAGHSRLEAAHKLGLKDVPVVFLNMSEAEAIEYGKYESNYLADAEKLIPRLRAFEHDSNKGMTMKELKLKYDDYNSLVNWQYLDKNGIFIQLLSMNDRSSFPHIERNAGWVGMMRKSFPQLTNLHEGEMYDLLYGIGGSKISKEMFIKIISNVVNNRRLDNTPNETPLGLDKTAKRGAQTRRDMESAQAELKRINAEMEVWKAHKAKAITTEEKEAVNALLANLQKEKSMVDGNISKMLKAQISLLGVGGKKADRV